MDEQRIVARIRTNRCAERFERDGKFLGAASGRAFRQRGGKQLVEAVGFRSLGRQAATDGGLEMHEGNAVIWDQCESQTVGQGVDLKPLLDASGFGGSSRRRSVERIENSKAESILRKCGGDAVNIGHRDRLNGREVAASEVEIAGFVPVRGEVRGAARSGRQAAELTGGDLAFGLGQVVIDHAANDRCDFGQNRLD